MSEELKNAVAVHAKLCGLTLKEAQEDAESLIRAYMENDHMTREFAESTFIEETEDASPEEMKRMEEGAKKIGALKVGAKSVVNAYGKKVERKRKPNNDKREIISVLDDALCDIADDVSEVSPEEEHKIDFILKGVEYTVTLTAHREKKA